MDKIYVDGICYMFNDGINDLQRVVTSEQGFGTAEGRIDEVKCTFWHVEGLKAKLSNDNCIEIIRKNDLFFGYET